MSASSIFQSKFNGPLLKGLLPSEVAVAEYHGVWNDMPIYVDEAKIVASSVKKRQLEFAGGRACARAALSQLQTHPPPILRDKNGAPLWPSGTTGSISHANLVFGAVAAHIEYVPAIGLDIELAGVVKISEWPLLFTQNERSRLCADSNPDFLSTLYFSAKEAFYKCQYSVTGDWLDFHDVEVETERHEFRIIANSRKVKMNRLGMLCGRFRFFSDIVVAVMYIQVADKAHCVNR